MKGIGNQSSRPINALRNTVIILAEYVQLDTCGCKTKCKEDKSTRQIISLSSGLVKEHKQQKIRISVCNK